MKHSRAEGGPLRFPLKSVAIISLNFVSFTPGQVYKQKLYGPKNVWMIIGWYPDGWYKVGDPKGNCTGEQLMEALQYHFTTEALILKPDDTPSISGMVS